MSAETDTQWAARQRRAIAFKSKCNKDLAAGKPKKGHTATQAIILAAGCGSRLGDANGRKPKCLATVSGRTLIDHQFAALSLAGIEDICVVPAITQKL